MKNVEGIIRCIHYHKILTLCKPLKELTIEVSFFMMVFILLLGCTSTKSIGYNPVTDLPKEIEIRYGTDLVPTEKAAIGIAEIVFKENSINTDFSYMKPFKIELIADGKVWYIRASNTQKDFIGIKNIYHIRINKNTAEVLNFWIER